MLEEVNFLVETAEEAMERALDHLNKELGKITTGKATPATVRDLLVNYYGTPTPMNQVANISTSDARSLVIQPWEKSMLAPIERSIFEANLGVTPMNDGEVVRLSFPPLTEERRRDLVKKSKALGEDAKVSSRSSRREAMEGIKKAVKDGFSEDEGKKREETVQQLTDKHIKKIDELLDAKEKEIMTVYTFANILN
jgi:ribosome recycling factor